MQTQHVAYVAWTKLQDVFDGEPLMRSVTLLGQLFTLQLKPDTRMQLSLMQVKVSQNQSLAMSGALISTYLATLVLIKLP